MSQFKGATVAEAIAQGLKILGLSKETATITVIEEEKKGFLGLGRKEAIVSIEPLMEEKVSQKVSHETNVLSMQDEQGHKSSVEEMTGEKDQDVINVLENLSETQTVTELALYLTKISQELGAPALVKVSHEQELVVFHLDSKKSGVLIGKHGRVLNAIQYLAQVFVHRVAKNRLSVVVNVGDYRERRQEAMQKLAKRTARKVEETGQPVFLEPMPAFERKIIHGFLTDHPYVETHSEGEEPHRYLVVEPRRDVF